MLAIPAWLHLCDELVVPIEIFGCTCNCSISNAFELVVAHFATEKAPFGQREMGKPSESRVMYALCSIPQQIHTQEMHSNYLVAVSAGGQESFKADGKIDHS